MSVADGVRGILMDMPAIRHYPGHVREICFLNVQNFVWGKVSFWNRISESSELAFKLLLNSIHLNLSLTKHLKKKTIFNVILKTYLNHIFIDNIQLWKWRVNGKWGLLRMCCVCVFSNSVLLAGHFYPTIAGVWSVNSNNLLNIISAFKQKWEVWNGEPRLLCSWIQIGLTEI